MTSLASTKGPSMTLSLPSAIRTCAPVATGIRPPLSSMRPALISRSASLCMASIISGGGCVEGPGCLTMYMKRILRAPSRGEPPASCPAELSRYPRRRTGPRQIDRSFAKNAPNANGAAGHTSQPVTTLLPQHDQRIGGVRHPPPLRVVVGLKMPDLAIGGQQQQCTALQPPLRRREGGHRRIAARLEEDLEIVRRRLGIGQGQAADRLAVAADHRPIADHLIHRFGQ